MEGEGEGVEEGARREEGVVEKGVGVVGVEELGGVVGGIVVRGREREGAGEGPGEGEGVELVA